MQHWEITGYGRGREAKVVMPSNVQWLATSLRARGLLVSAKPLHLSWSPPINHLVSTMCIVRRRTQNTPYSQHTTFIERILDVFNLYISLFIPPVSSSRFSHVGICRVTYLLYLPLLVPSTCLSTHVQTKSWKLGCGMASSCYTVALCYAYSIQLAT
jgi:hypothetical protein